MHDNVDTSRNVLVSIGIPTYNRPELLTRALNCAVSQTYEHLEILVSDNCSSDSRVRDTLEEFEQRDIRVKTFIQQKNYGIRHNIHFLVEKTSGKYFMFLADDDLISDNFVEESVKFLEENQDYSMVSGTPFAMEGDTNHCKALPVMSLESTNRNMRIFSYILNVYDNCVYYSLFRKCQLDYVFPIPGFPCNDWLMLIRLLYLGRSKILQNIRFYKNADGVSSDVKTLGRAFNCHSFWAKHYTLTLYINLCKEVSTNTYLGQKIVDKIMVFLMFSSACFLKATYKDFTKKYLFHIMYLCLPRRLYQPLRSLKRKAFATLSKLLP